MATHKHCYYYYYFFLRTNSLSSSLSLKEKQSRLSKSTISGVVSVFFVCARLVAFLVFFVSLFFHLSHQHRLLFLCVSSVLFFHQRERERERKEVKKFRDMWVFKIFNFAAKKVGVAFVEYSGAKEYLETRTQRAPQRHLSAPLKTDCNPTSVPRRQGIPELLRVCPPGRNPGGNTRRSGVHRVSSCFLSLCSRILSLEHHFFSSAEVEIFSAKRPTSRCFLGHQLRSHTKIQKIT